jgi:hypothetical protein
MWSHCVRATFLRCVLSHLSSADLSLSSTDIQTQVWVVEGGLPLQLPVCSSLDSSQSLIRFPNKHSGTICRGGDSSALLLMRGCPARSYPGVLSGWRTTSGSHCTATAMGAWRQGRQRDREGYRSAPGVLAVCSSQLHFRSHEADRRVTAPHATHSIL